jgi:excisionase family DNA binding protein
MPKAKLLSTAFVAEQFAVSHRTVVRWIRSGRIKAINVGSVKYPRYRIPEDQLSNVVVSSQSRMPEGVEEII